LDEGSSTVQDDSQESAISEDAVQLFNDTQMETIFPSIVESEDNNDTKLDSATTTFNDLISQNKDNSQEFAISEDAIQPLLDDFSSENPEYASKINNMKLSREWTLNQLYEYCTTNSILIPKDNILNILKKVDKQINFACIYHKKQNGN